MARETTTRVPALEPSPPADAGADEPVTRPTTVVSAGSVGEARRPRRGPATVARRLWSTPLWAHCLALGLLLAVLFPFMSPRSSFTSDEGAYALQARALQDGSWTYDYKAAPVDPDGKAFPLVLSGRSGDQYYAYIQHPAYGLLLTGASTVVGSTVGLHLLALVGTLGTAVAAWLLAGALDPRLRRPAFWVAALSPALVNGFLLWAHTLAAAIAGLTLVALVRALKGGATVRWTAAAAAGLAALVLVRSEGLLFAGAVAAVAAIVVWRRPATAGPAEVPSPAANVAPSRSPIRAVRAGVMFGALAGPAIVANLAERLWVRAIAGGVYDNLHDRAAGTPWLAGRLSAVRHDLFQGPDVAGSGRVLALVALVAVVGFGVLGLRRWRDDSVRALGIGAAVAIGLTVVQFVRYPAEPVSGLFAAWPVALLGLVLVRWRREGPVVPVLGAVAGLFSLAVIATEYAEGGGLQWGGRFFFPVLAPLAVLAVVGIDRRLAAAPQAGRYAATGLVAAVAVTSALYGVASAGRLRADQGGVVAAAARHPAPVTITTVPALPRVAWSTHDTLNWMLTDADGLQDVLTGLRSSGFTEVAVITRYSGLGPDAAAAGFPHVEGVDEPALRERNMSLFILRA